MIKKKVNEDYKSKNIIFDIEGTKYQLIRFYQAKMTIDVIEVDSKDKSIRNMPFAHMPKATKKLIKPN